MLVDYSYAYTHAYTYCYHILPTVTLPQSETQQLFLIDLIGF